MRPVARLACRYHELKLLAFSLDNKMSLKQPQRAMAGIETNLVGTLATMEWFCVIAIEDGCYKPRKL